MQTRDIGHHRVDCYLITQSLCCVTWSEFITLQISNVPAFPRGPNSHTEAENCVGILVAKDRECSTILCAKKTEPLGMAWWQYQCD